MHNEKTEEELAFIKIFTRLICMKTAFEYEKERRMLEFLTNSEFYYDVLCEAIYSVMNDDGVETLSLDEKGFSRLNLFSPLGFDAGFELLSKDDVSNPDDDVVVYINIVLQRLMQRVAQEERRRA